MSLEFSQSPVWKMIKKSLLLVQKHVSWTDHYLSRNQRYNIPTLIAPTVTSLRFGGGHLRKCRGTYVMLGASCYGRDFHNNSEYTELGLYEKDWFVWITYSESSDKNSYGLGSHVWHLWFCLFFPCDAKIICLKCVESLMKERKIFFFPTITSTYLTEQSFLQ